ncbi:MAG: hypothetical protein ACYTGG_02345 [Planctomycetota bacterium]|jgi:hypothetical protein
MGSPERGLGLVELEGAEPEPMIRVARVPEPDERDAPAAAAAIQVVKRRIEVLLREVVAETVESSEAIDDELVQVHSHPA